MIGQEPLETWYFSGHSTVYGSIPSRIGADAVLDAAAAFTVDSHDAFMTGCDVHEKAAHTSGIQAMQSLRTALARSGEQSDTVLISTMCLKTSEVCFLGGLHVPKIVTDRVAVQPRDLQLQLSISRSGDGTYPEIPVESRALGRARAATDMDLSCGGGKRMKVRLSRSFAKK